MPASRAMASAVASAYPTRAKTAAAASLRRVALPVLPDLERRGVPPARNCLARAHCFTVLVRSADER